jgi:hypothetical protein
MPRRRGLRPQLLVAVLRSNATSAFAPERLVVGQTAMPPRRVREEIGPFVVTAEKDLDPQGLVCAECERVLAETADTESGFSRSPEELVAAGAIAVPNFGWFCDQACAERYEDGTGIRFDRDADGRISYYS